MASSRAVRAGRAAVEFFLDDNPLRRGLTLAERRMRQFGATVQNIGRTAFTAGLGGAAAFALPVRQMMSFDDAIRAAAATTDDAAGSLGVFKDIALEIAKTSGFTATEVANMMTELARAGHTDPTSIKSMTAAVLSMSKATGTDATRSAEILIATMNQYKMAAGEAARVSDVLTLAANMTSTSVDALGEAMSYAGPVAAGMGMSLEDTVAILGQLGNIGIQGSNAGTALRRMVTMTGAEAEKMKEIFGVSFVNADGSLRPLITVMGELGEAMQGLPDSTKIAKYNEAFGLLGITSSIEIANSAKSIQTLSNALSEGSGAAADAAKFMEGGLGGAFRRMLGAADAAAIGIGNTLTGSLESLGGWIGASATQIATWVSQNEGLVVSAAKGTSYLLAGGAALIFVGKAFAIAAVGTKILGLAITALTTWWIALPAAIIGVAGYIAYTSGLFTAFATTLTETFGGAWDLIVTKIGSGDLAGAMKFAWELTKAAFDLGILYVQQAWGGFSNWLAMAVHDTGALVGEIWGVLWDQLTSVAGYAWAAIKDTLQAIIDWGNRLVGRNVPDRKSNVSQIAEENSKRAEERAQANMDSRNELTQMLASNEDARQSAVDAQLAKINELIRTEQQRTEQAASGTMAAAEQTGLAPPQQALANTLMAGTSAAMTARASAITAVDKNSAEGQKLVYELLDQSGKQDETVGAIGSLENTLVDEFERTRREDKNAPRLQGSRRA